MDLVRLARGNGLSREEALQGALQAILVSPHFLFRVEQDPDPADEDGLRELNDFELASRLSYFLWSSMPDEELFELAVSGELGNDAALTAQVRRMLQDPKSEAIIKNFAGQWLQLRDLANLRGPEPDAVGEILKALHSALDARAAVAHTDAAKARRRAEILGKALELHRHEGDSDCPVCGNASALTADWMSGSFPIWRALMRARNSGSRS